MRFIPVLALISALGLPFPASSNGMLWSRITGTNDIDENGRIAVDSRKNIYLAFQSRIDEESAGESDTSFPRMRLVKHDSSGKRLWIRSFKSDGWNYPTDMAVDANDDVYILGRFMGHFEGNEGFDDYDGCLVKLDGSGKIQWSRVFGTQGIDLAENMAIGSRGNIYVTVTSKAAWEGKPKNERGDIVLLKFDPHGNRKWTRFYGFGREDFPYGISLDARENLYLAALTRISPADSSKADTLLHSLVKFDSSGNRKWVLPISKDSTTGLRAITVDKLGGIYLAGWTKSSMDGKTLPSDGTFMGSYFLTRYDTAGTRQWLRQSRNRADLIALAADGSGNAYLFGNASDSLDGASASGGLFLLKYDKDGSRKWTRTWGTAATQDAQDMAVDQDGFLYLTGRADGASKGLDVSNLGIMKWTPEPPSFDCVKASTPQEKMICGDFQLSRLDDSLATLYSAARKAASKPDELKAEQIDWLKSKRNACKTPEDLRRTLRERIGVLQARTGSR
jgi:uncharacterized protein YecT (DUF1311 family)